jgi:cyclase
MLKRRIIPKLLLRAGRTPGPRRMVLVTTLAFRESFEIGDPVSQAKVFEAQAADELVFLDLDASADRRRPLLDLVSKAAEEIFMPLGVGGGIRSAQDVRDLLRSGADKVVVNSAAAERPELLRELAGEFGSQCVVLSIDYRGGPDGRAEVFTRGGSRATGLDPLDWARRGVELGAGEILLTSIDRDGSRRGLDLPRVRALAESVPVPVIASGGCGSALHFVEGFRDGKADAVAAGTFFCFKDENQIQLRSQVRNAGIPVRRHP